MKTVNTVGFIALFKTLLLHLSIFDLLILAGTSQNVMEQQSAKQLFYEK